MTIRAVVCDDETRLASEIRGAVNRGLKLAHVHAAVKVLEPAEALKEFSGLQERRDRLRKAKRRTATASEFDDADLVVVDYDLLELESASGLSTTGAEIAYLLRCFSTCGPIIVLNRYMRETDFDLSFDPHMESFADLDLRFDHLKRRGLWTTKWRRGDFRPWAWPVLPWLVESWKLRVAWFRTRLDTPVWKALDLDSKARALIAREQLRRLGIVKDDQGSGPTIRQLLTDSPRIGLQAKDRKHIGDDALARIAAARIVHWIERVLAPGQDVIIDAPHLLERFPRSRSGRPEVSATLSPDAAIHGLVRQVHAHAWKPGQWLQRPWFKWWDLQSDATLADVRDPWNVERPSAVFCEDTSRFVPRARAKSFLLDLPTSFSTRWVESLKDVKYEPALMFAV